MCHHHPYGGGVTNNTSADTWASPITLNFNFFSERDLPDGPIECCRPALRVGLHGPVDGGSDLFQWKPAIHAAEHHSALSDDLPGNRYSSDLMATSLFKGCNQKLLEIDHCVNWVGDVIDDHMLAWFWHQNPYYNLDTWDGLKSIWFSNLCWILIRLNQM